MSKISIEELESILLQRKVSPTEVQAIVQDCERVVDELKSDRGSVSKTKWETVIILNDPEGYLRDKEIAGWVVKQKAGDDAGLILSKLTSAAVTQNENIKRKKSVIENIVQLFESLKSKFLKEKELKIQTKDLTRVIITNGKF